MMNLSLFKKSLLVLTLFPMLQLGIVGLNPYARVKFITVDLLNLMSPPYRLTLSNQVEDAAKPTPWGKEIKVANFSWEYSNQVGGVDPIQNSIEDLKQSTLFVTAAGNAPESREHACGDLPACLSDLENVITVVGLDRNMNQPQLWREGDRGSNWSQKFNIGAIAENVLSTTYHHYTGRFSGTSQAAPQVTATASLLYSIYETHHRIDTPELLPVRIKNRLIYSSDIFNGLLDKMQGGRLNVERALDVARDYVLIEKAGERKAYTGTLVRFGV